MSDSPAGQPESNVYTVLVIVATILIASATVFLAVRSEQLPRGGKTVFVNLPPDRNVQSRRVFQ